MAPNSTIFDCLLLFCVVVLGFCTPTDKSRSEVSPHNAITKLHGTPETLNLRDTLYVLLCIFSQNKAERGGIFLSCMQN